MSHPCTSLRTMYRSRRLFLKRHRLICVVASLSAKSYADCGYTLVNAGMMPQLFAGLRLAVLENHFILFLHVEVNAYVAPFLVKNKRFFLRHTLRSKISIICEACSKSLPKTTGGSYQFVLFLQNLSKIVEIFYCLR